MNKVRAKMNCTSVVELPDGGKTVYLEAVYSREPGNPNAAFAAATPHANCQLSISAGKEALGHFKQGGVYYVDFLDAAEADAEESGAQLSLDELKANADALQSK